MEKGYFAAAWGDVTRSPGWVSKLMRLGLLLLVPVFGAIVLYGYLYAWARDIAWNVHRPLPDRIFGNEDGNLYKRGFFILVIGLVFSLIPAIFNGLASVFSGVSIVGIGLGSYAALDGMASSAGGGLFVGFLLNVVAFVLSLAVAFFVWVGSMRCAVYGTLSSGFQISKIWAMLRYDFAGLLRIFGMVILCNLVVGVIAFVCIFLVVFVGAFAAFAFAASELPGVIAAFGVLLLVIAAVVAALFVSVLIEALTVRALGYWTRQFEVHLWGGQEDPLPFEQRAATAGQQAQNPAGQQGYPYGQAADPYAQGQWQQQAYQQAGWSQQPGWQAQGVSQGQRAGAAQQPTQAQQSVAGVWPAGTTAPQPVAASQPGIAPQPEGTQPVAAFQSEGTRPDGVCQPEVVSATPQPAAAPTTTPQPAAEPPVIVETAAPQPDAMSQSEAAPAAVPQPAAEPPVIAEPSGVSGEAAPTLPEDGGGTDADKR